MLALKFLGDPSRQLGYFERVRETIVDEMVAFATSDLGYLGEASEVRTVNEAVTIDLTWRSRARLGRRLVDVPRIT